MNDWELARESLRESLRTIMGLFSSGEAAKEMKELLENLPDFINSVEEFQKYLKTLSKLEISSTLGRLGISGKRIKKHED